MISQLTRYIIPSLRSLKEMNVTEGTEGSYLIREKQRLEKQAKGIWQDSRLLKGCIDLEFNYNYSL